MFPLVISTAIDEELEAAQPALGGLSYLDYLALSQESYRSTHGKYWQGLPLTETIPSNKIPVETRPTICPHDQLESWHEVMPEVPAELISQPQIDVISPPDSAPHYELHVRFACDGVIYQRTFTGPEASGWTEVERDGDS